jgi:hypothetical protein
MSKLDGCSNRFAHQLERVGTLVGAIDLSSEAEASRKIADTLVEAVIIMIAAYLDDYLRCVLYVASFHNRQAIVPLLPKDWRTSMPAGASEEVYLATKAKSFVSFKKGGRSLDNAFTALFGTSIWPDVDTGRLVRDLVRVRNIYVHSGGWPEAAHMQDVETPGLIVYPHNKFFHKLNVQPFFRKMLRAVGGLATHVSRLADARYP